MMSFEDYTLNDGKDEQQDAIDYDANEDVGGQFGSLLNELHGFIIVCEREIKQSITHLFIFYKDIYNSLDKYYTYYWR